MKKIIVVICIIILLLTLTNCDDSLIQVDETESEITESTTVIDIVTDESPATSIVLSEFENVEEITVSQYVNEIELPFDSDSVNNLKNIYVHEDNEIYYDIDGVLFLKETATLLYYPKGKVDTQYTIPDGTKIIGSYAFYGNHILEIISFAESVERIEKYVIYKCDSISSISIHSNDTIISNLSFVYEHEDERVFSETFKSVTFDFGSDNTLELLENKVGDIYIYVTAIFPIGGDMEYGFYGYSPLNPDDDTLEPRVVYYDESQTGHLSNDNGKWDSEHVTYGDFEVREYKQEVHILDYIGTESHVIIPETINDKPVTAIMKWNLGYENNSDIKELTIPMYLHDIDPLYLSPGGNINIPAFFPTLENIHVDKDNPYLYSVDGALFSYNNSELLYCPDRHGVYEIPDGTKSIAYEAFLYNNLTELIIPSSVQTIASFILENCDEITTIRLPGKYVDIDESAFDYSWNFGTLETYLSESIKDIYIDTELSVYENEVDDFYEYFYNRFRIENVTVHFKDYKFTYADNVISKYSADSNELIEKYDREVIMILNTAKTAKTFYENTETRILQLVDLTLDGIPELVRVYGQGTGQSYDIYDISDDNWYSFLMYGEKAFIEFHHYVNTLINESVWIMTETDFSLDNGRSEETSQISSNPKISKMVVSAIIYYESSVEYKINRDLTEIDISECETVTEEEYNKFMEDYYSSLEETPYPYVSKAIEPYYWDDIAKKTVEMTRDEVSKVINEAYSEYIALYEEFVK